MSCHSPAELAEVAFHQGDGQELAAIVMGAIAGQAEREGRTLTIGELLCRGVGPLLSAAWKLREVGVPR